MILEYGREVLRKEASAILELESQIGREFVQAVKTLSFCTGKIITMGIGKSGIICKKISSTLSSTGSSSFYISPVEAIHGDLGNITVNDVILFISNSGETLEIKQVLPYIVKLKIPIISITGNINSFLAKFSDIILTTKIEKEACPFNLAPTTSSTLALAMGDALAVSLMQEKKFKRVDFIKFHPGGKLGEGRI